MKNRIKLLIVIVGVLFAALLFTQSTQHAQTQTAQVETAGQHFKNIKVLNDMPADQMGRVMNLMAASLGVNCNYCHVEGDFSKDDKREKATGREMLKMTMEINKTNFNNRPEISCNTCHNGHTHPQSSPNLAPVAAAATDERPKQPDTKPTIDQILDKYTESLGGKSNIEKIASRTITATRIEPGGRTEPEEISQKGNKVLIVTTYPQAVVNEAFDGTGTWKNTPRGPVNLRKDESDQITRNAQILTFADLKTVYSKIDFRFVDKIDGREVYLVQATNADNTRERLYFDTQTGLLVRRTSTSPTVIGNFLYQVDYSDYKDFGGVKLPTTIRVAMPGISWTRKITDVKSNVTIDDAKFAPAPVVK